MNERIRDLQIQAFAECKTFEGGKFQRTDEVFERFAELIVRECAQFVEDKFDFVGDEIIVKEKMLEHFGIDQGTDEESVEICPLCGLEWSGTSCGLQECGWVVGVEE